jgi:formamidopyrimidine-DNA glycosylase
VLIHLGMSGSLRVISPTDPWKTHDHVGITLKNGRQLRFHDPRRFGLVLRLTGDPLSHPLLKDLGPEPLGEGFTAAHLQAACAKRSAAIKLVIMDAKVVVGVGNIYASEALFRAGILPRTPAKRVSKPRLAKLAAAIREVLTDAIAEGGTTLRDFLHSDGEPGYFRQKLFVYDRKGGPCRVCGTLIRHAVIGQRSTYWCPQCQK